MHVLPTILPSPKNLPIKTTLLISSEMLGQIDVLRASLAELLIKFAELLIAVGVKASELTDQVRIGCGFGVELGEFLD